MEQEKTQLYFDFPAIRMKPIERIIFRIAVSFGLVCATALFASFIISSVMRLKWLGALGLIFIADYLARFNSGDKKLSFFKEDCSRGTKINIASYFGLPALHSLEKAAERAEILGGNYFLNLADLLVRHKDVREGLFRMGVPLDELEQKIKESLANSRKNKPTQKEVVGAAEKIGITAFEAGLKTQEFFISLPDLFSALAVSEDEEIDKIFMLFGIEPDDLENSLIFGRFEKKFGWLKTLPATLGGFAGQAFKSRHRTMNRAWTARPTPILDSFSVDFTDLARSERIGFLIGHEEEYSRLVDVLSRSAKPNALLVGDPGSGKESIVAHLAFELIKDRVPKSLFDKRLVCLKLGNLISGASPEEISSRMNKLAAEIVSAGNIILYIEDVHNLVKTSGVQNLSAADILLPIIGNDAFPVIGSTYPQEFKKIIEPQTDFTGSFETIPVQEVSEDEAIKILTYESVILERQHRMTVSFNAVKEAVRLAHKYFRQKLLPSSAEDLLKEALSDASQRRKKILRPEDVIFVAERKTKIPIHQAGKEEVEQLLNLESLIHSRLVDQEEAVSAVSRALREYRSGLSRKGGPIAAFLFVGPTGVGKTELSKTLAQIQFGSENMMLRFDMSEFQEKQSLNRFIGSPDGQIAGGLTEAVIQKPFSLILLDEFEKAHPDILNIFLQVLDDGRLTDNLGRTVDFTNTIIIATSNANSDFIKTHLESGTPIATIAVELKKKLTDVFKPELLNRFSDIIVFKTLSPDDIKKIATFQLNDLAKTVKEAQGIIIKFDESAVGKIAEMGFDPVFGARPLRGVISENLRSILAEKILKKEIVGGDTILISCDGGFKFGLMK